MKKIVFALMLCLSSISYAKVELTAQQLVSWCELEAKSAKRIAEYKSMGFTQQETHKMILNGNFNIRDEPNEVWSKWLITITNIVYQDSDNSPEEISRISYSACIYRLTKDK